MWFIRPCKLFFFPELANFYACIWSDAFPFWLNRFLTCVSGSHFISPENAEISKKNTMNKYILPLHVNLPFLSTIGWTTQNVGFISFGKTLLCKYWWFIDLKEQSHSIIYREEIEKNFRPTVFQHPAIVIQFYTSLSQKRERDWKKKTNHDR